jgi:Immunoglobulin-like domain of bacterial spore germination
MRFKQKYKYYFIGAISVLAVGIFLVMARGNEDTWLCQNSQWVKHGNPAAAKPTSGCGRQTVLVACTQEARLCPDGTAVGRTGLNCEFEACPTSASVTSEPEALKASFPKPDEVVSSPLKISGQARGSWFFEGSFPVLLTAGDGTVIARGVATAKGDWMTQNFVSFSASLIFIKPAGSNSGFLLFKKDNPSGLPQNDQSYKIPVSFK